MFPKECQRIWENLRERERVTYDRIATVHIPDDAGVSPGGARPGGRGEWSERIAVEVETTEEWGWWGWWEEWEWCAECAERKSVDGEQEIEAGEAGKGEEAVDAAAEEVTLGEGGSADWRE
jgi:hypothetical protein